MNSESSTLSRTSEKVQSCITDAMGSFSWAFLGLAAIRIWIQCTMYDRYAYTDSGPTTVMINLIRVAFIALLVLIVIIAGFPRKFRTILGWFSVTAMTFSGVLFLINVQLGLPLISHIACLLAGLGIVWGGGMWMEFYIRLCPTVALIYATMSLALGSLGGLILGFMPDTVGIMISIIMPTVSFVAWTWSMRLADQNIVDTPAVPPHKQIPSYTADAATHDSKKQHIPDDPQPIDTIYDAEPPLTFIRLLIGLALFMFVLGIARGFPFGSSIQLAPLYQTIHQMTSIILCMAILWWVIGRNHFMRYSTLWRTEVIFVAIGVILLSSLDTIEIDVGSVCILIANTMILLLLWYTCYDIARHSSHSPYVILGICWIVLLLFRETGRLLIIQFPPESEMVMLVVTLMICLVTVCIAVLFGDAIPHRRPLFNDIKTYVEKEYEREHPQPREQEHDQNQNMRRVDLIALYSLTNRESQVVDLMMEGLSKASIGERLFISENTVRGYVKNAYTKMDVHNKKELAAKYYTSK
ncbi:MAG: helix-turn-helix transcriptional regulator [Eggerthellaceae bacterium]|nr:helix-turn-helix transcriptional regulator [Eggerthellaceae bacterium]